ncbi:hypothetical protein HK104_008875 [Borealophlyctis nickersoniae]|nr:hypothetical protein HK104_008875 [Borealophlyctis nickersoniae]
MPTQADLDLFAPWLAANGCVYDSITFKPSVSSEHSPAEQDRGIGIFATKPLTLRPEDTVASVPASLCLNASKVAAIATASETDAAERLKRCLEGVKTVLRGGKAGGDIPKPIWERTALVVFLIFARHCLEDPTHPSQVPMDPTDPSFWLPYVRVLPTSLSAPLFYPPDSLAVELLMGTGLDTAYTSKLAKLHREHESLLPYLRLLSETPNASATDFETFKWADGVFWSRVISFKSIDEAMPGTTSKHSVDVVHGDDDFHLVPLIDFCNHSFSPQLRWHVASPIPSSTMRRAPGKLSGSRIELRAALSGIGETNSGEDGEIKVEAGQELFITYGEKPNSELVFVHGFAVDGNPFDSVSFPAPFVEAQMAAAAEQEDTREGHGDGPRKQDEGEEEEDTDSAAAELAGSAMLAVRDKITFLSCLNLRPIVDIRTPHLDAVDDNDVSSGILAQGALVTAYCSVLTAEDGFGRTDDGLATTPEFGLGGQPIRPLTQERFLELVDALPHVEIVRLRVWTVLLELVGYRMAELTGRDEDGEEDAKEELQSAAVQVLRGGQYEILAHALQRLGELQEKYVEMPSVVEYLRAMQEDFGM